MRIEYATEEQVRDVALRMRATDFAEFSAVSHARTREDLADLLAARYGGQPFTLCASVDDRPVAIGAVLEARPNVASLMFFATDEFPTIAGPLTRFIRRKVLEPMKQSGVHRIETVSMLLHRGAHRWLTALGLEKEAGPFRGYGRNGEPFVQYAWVADDFRAARN